MSMSQRLCVGALTSLLSLPGLSFELTSDDIHEGQLMPKAMEFAGFGCNGRNSSPQLSWHGAPEGTLSFAITAYDPDAPTGSGWWHWVVTDLPATTGVVARGASGKLAAGREFRNDYGAEGFGGACPPVGHGMHRYQFTVWALPEKTLALPEGASAALIGYMLRAKSLGRATLTATYSR